MTARYDLGRYTSFPREPDALARELSEFARDANLALQRRVPGFVYQVLGYRATGDADTILQLTQTKAPPFAVVLVRCERVDNPRENVPARGGLQFFFDRGALSVFEPDGLTQDVLYNLSFLIVEV